MVVAEEPSAHRDQRHAHQAAAFQDYLILRPGLRQESTTQRDEFHNVCLPGHGSRWKWPLRTGGQRLAGSGTNQREHYRVGDGGANTVQAAAQQIRTGPSLVMSLHLS